jgi:hypothetical protein
MGGKYSTSPLNRDNDVNKRSSDSFFGGVVIC